MLGGPIYIAFIRFAISLAGVILLFSEMSESRFDRKKTVVCYGERHDYSYVQDFNGR